MAHASPNDASPQPHRKTAAARASDFDLIQRPVAELEHAIAGGERATRAYREALATFESAGEDKAEATEAERRLRTYPDGSTAQTADGQWGLQYSYAHIDVRQ